MMESDALPPRLGPYAIVRRIGGGAMATVHEAIHVGLGKPVAIKVMQADLRADPRIAARFLREGRAAARVRHPNVVDVSDVGSHAGIPYLVMELLQGVDLGEHLGRKDRLSLDETLEIMLPVVCAVAAAHDVGVLHRDLKPTNIFLAKGRHGALRPTVVDFGVSAFMDRRGEDPLTRSGTVLGSLQYMSPEQTRGAKHADARSDQYSLGAVLYRCTTGRPPFVVEGAYHLIRAIGNDPLVPPSHAVPDLAPDFDRVLVRALARAPADRFDSVKELGRALLPFAAPGAAADWARELV